MVAAAVVGSAALGAVTSSKASSKAAKAQTEAADQASETQQAQYEQTRADSLPWMNRGNAAGDRLSYLLGTGGTPGSAAPVAPSQTSFDQAGYDAAMATYNQQLGQWNAQEAAVAAQPQESAQSLAKRLGHWVYDRNAEDNIWVPLAGQEKEFYKTYGDSGSDTPISEQTRWGVQVNTPDRGAAPVAPNRDQFTTQAPVAAQAQQAAGQPAAQNSEYGSLLRNFTQDDLNSDVVYQNGLQFGLDQGTKGINNQAAASGSMLSGATLKALTKYGNDYATTKTADAYNRFQTNKNSNYNMLAGVSGTGQTANSLVASSGANTANQVSSNQLASGNARAASAIGSANALTNGISSGYNMYQSNQLVNSLTNRNVGVAQLPGVSNWVSQG